MKTSAGERLLKITSRAEDNSGGITFNTGSAASERARITNSRFTINNTLVATGTLITETEESPVFRFSGSTFEASRMILAPLTFVKIFETPSPFEPNENWFSLQNMQSYGNWNGVSVPNVINVPVTFNLLIQGYMGFVATQVGRRTGVMRLTNKNASFFIEATNILAFTRFMNKSLPMKLYII